MTPGTCKRMLMPVVALLIAQAAFAEPVDVIFETTAGNFTLSLDETRAPASVENFLNYVDGGFYDNTVFHRVIPGFVVQGGGFEPGMRKKQTLDPIANESGNGLTNRRGTISMARTRNPDSATSQFFINVADNRNLDSSDSQPGYAVFGEISSGMEVIDQIVTVPTQSVGRYSDVPAREILILSARRADSAVANAAPRTQPDERYIAGQHYTVLKQAVPTRDAGKVEVVKAFSYGCTPCYSLEPVIAQWYQQQSSDVDFWQFPAVWNEPMKLYAKTFFAAEQLGVLGKTHVPLFTAIVVQQKKLSNEEELAEFFAQQGISRDAFTQAFNSASVAREVDRAEKRVRSYNLASAPEFIVNGKYRVDRMRAGGPAEMLEVVSFLVAKERELLRGTTYGSTEH